MTAEAEQVEKPNVRVASYLTVAQFHRLDWACRPINRAFDCAPYLVGSVQTRPDFRDVDLRLPMGRNERWHGSEFVLEDKDQLLVINIAISELLRSQTGLPIDFQFQSLNEWEQYDTTRRNPMGVR
jgi:hypothetical protein